jgi:hypothetical protein
MPVIRSAWHDLLPGGGAFRPLSVTSCKLDMSRNTHGCDVIIQRFKQSLQQGSFHKDQAT